MVASIPEPLKTLFQKPLSMAENASFAYAIKSYGLKSFLRNAFSIAISDAVVVSFQKSGRTWLRLMLGKVLEKQYSIKKIRLDTEYITLFKPLPNILFSHAGCTKKHNKLSFQRIFRRKKIILLTRDPRAVIVSLFHDHTKRNFWYEGNNLSDFIRSVWGLSKIINFMNSWAEEVKRRNKEDCLILTYENFYTKAAEELKRFLNFLELKHTDEIIAEAVQYGSVDSMRKMELNNAFKDQRMAPGDKKDQQSYRTRKCKLGSFKEELSKEDLSYIDQELKAKLDPLFGYNYSTQL